MRVPRICQEPQSNIPRTRKGHKKSRGGCFNCKRRKIKATRTLNPESHVANPLQCQENHPVCHNCVRIKVHCTYPFSQPQTPSPVLLDTRSLQSTPTVFTASDMRLFHHFIISAYPHLPLGNESVWVRDIPSFSHSVSQISLDSHNTCPDLFTSTISSSKQCSACLLPT